MKVKEIRFILSDKIRVSYGNETVTKYKIIWFDKPIFSMSVADIAIDIEKQTGIEVELDLIRNFLKSEEVEKEVLNRIYEHNGFKESLANLEEIEKIRNFFDENLNVKSVIYDIDGDKVNLFVEHDFNGITKTSHYETQTTNISLGVFIALQLIQDYIRDYDRLAARYTLTSYIYFAIPMKLIRQIHDSIKSLTILDSMDTVLKDVSDSVDKKKIQATIKLRQVYK